MDVAEATEAYAAYLNGRHRAAEEYDPAALEEFELDMERARRQMEIAWLERGMGA